MEKTNKGASFSSIFLRPANPNGQKDTSNYCCRQFCFAITILILMCVGIQGFFVPGVIRKKIWQGIEDTVIHTEVDWGKSSFCSWQNNTGEDDSKIYFDLYLYNVTNPEEVKRGAVPKLKMVGPFSYHRYQIKYNPKFSEDKTYVSYVEWTHYKWNQAGSAPGLQPDTNITILNPIFFALMQMPQHLDPITAAMAWYALSAATTLDDIFLTGRANDLIFGIDVPILVTLKQPPYNFTMPGGSTQFKMFSNTTNPLISEAIWGTVSIFTGHDDRKKVGMQRTFNGSEQIWYYRDPFSLAPAYADFYGVDRIKKGEDLLIWVEDVYRNAEFGYNDSMKHHGVEVYRYFLKMHPQLDNTTTAPQNEQFYQFGPPGVVNMSSCPPGSKALPFPLFIGKPHFKDSGWEWTNKFLSLDEPSDWDETFVDIEPISGATFRAKKFLQFNFPYNTSWDWYNNTGGGNIPNLPNKFNGLHNTTYMHPFGAAMEHFEVTEDDCKTFVKDVYGGRLWATVAFVAGIVSWSILGIIMLCILHCVFFRKKPVRGSINDGVSGRSSTARWKTYGNTGDFTTGHPTQDYTMLPEEESANQIGTGRS